MPNIPASFSPTYPDNSTISISTVTPYYTGAQNLNPQLSWTVGALPVGAAVSNYIVHLQNLSTNQVLWHVTGIPSTTSAIGAGVTVITGATIQRNYLMTTSGSVGVGSVTPSAVAIGASYISGISTVGYSGPQPPPGERHIYRLSISASLAGSPSTLSTSITVGFGTTGSTLIAATAPIVFPDNNSVIVGGAKGISTCIPASIEFRDFVKINDLIKFTKPGDALPTFGKVVGIGSTSFQLEATPAVEGVCNIGVSTRNITVSDATVVVSKYSSSSDNSFYTPLPKQNVENINLTNSKIIIRKQYNIVSTGGTTNTITCLPEESFLPYTKDRYALVYQDGRVEALREDQLNILTNSKSIFINGLSGNGNCILTCSLEKINVSSKVKRKNRVGSIIIDKSKNTFSSTSTDGLVYGNYPYGTRIQDREISLNIPDVIKVYGVYESLTSSDPSAPIMTLNSLSGPSNSTSDFTVGEIITGQTTRAKAIIAEKKSQNEIVFIYINSNKFLKSEKIESKETNIIGSIQSIEEVSKNITSYYKFNDGQNQNFYNYSSIIRSNIYTPPSKKIKVYYLSAYFSATDNGDLTVVNSYNEFDYKNEIRTIDNVRNTDIIDIRPRVSNYSVLANKKSPFEFDSRSFNRFNGSAFNVLAADESLNISYSYYLPRIDKIYLTKNGLFEVKYGYDSESSQITDITDNAIEIASIMLSPYLFNVNQSIVDITRYKKYTIQDIKSIDNRLKNIEKSTSLSLLEIETNSLFIRDINGSNRFKVGFFVDDFSSLSTQELSIGIKNSIDIENKELRPAHNTTSIDLILGSDLIQGITSTTNLNGDSRYLNSIQGNNIKKTGDLITLNYQEKEWIKNPFATGSEKLTPFYGSFWQGKVELNPSSDTWLDESKISTKNINVNSSYLGFSEWFIGTEDLDINTGFIPVQWNSWKSIWSGIDSSNENEIENTTNYSDKNYLGNGSISNRLNELNYSQDQFVNGIVQSSVKIGKEKHTFKNDNDALGTLSVFSNRNKRRNSIREVLNVYNVSNKIVSNDITSYVRSRNIDFIGRELKPYTRVYAYLDGIDVNQFIVPKLLEISMNAGIFTVGETVIGYSATTKEPLFKFRVASSNHKEGSYNNPSKVFDINPYNKLQTISSTYSATSDILNIDTYSLSEMNNFDFYGYPEIGMTLIGQTSNSEASVQNIRLITDKNGYICGSLFINNPNNNNKPSFETGEKTFTLTSNLSNSKFVSAITTIAEESFNSQGVIEYEYDSVLSTRTVKIQRKTLKDFDSKNKFNISSTSSRSIQNYTNTSNYDETNGLYFDPLSQTFFVDDETGIFVNKLDVYFKTKDEFLPVNCQIRTVKNEIPSDIVLPFSEVTLDSSDVSISSDSSLKTTFNFQSPVYLKGKTEYAIVLTSSSPNYEVWTSKNGEVSNRDSTQSFGGVVSKHPLIKKLFKPQNASNWQGSVFESLKFTLNRLSFDKEGTINFYNPNLFMSNGHVQNLINNPILTQSRKIRVGLSNTISDAGISTGQIIGQLTSNATGVLVGLAGSAFGPLKIINAGIGYTPSSGITTYTNVTLNSITGKGRNARATITVNNGFISTTGTFITHGGSGYEIGDVLSFNSLGSSTLGSGARLSVGIITSLNELVIDKVQGEFLTGATNNITYIDSSGITRQLNFSTGNAFPVSPIIIENDGLHFKVSQRNHGMYGNNNFVTISNVVPDTIPSKLTRDLTASASQIIVDSATQFSTFENLGVSTSNYGYLLIDDEIIGYESVTNGTIVTGSVIGITTRGVDGTRIKSHVSGSSVYKYEIGGISLRRINTNHDLSLVSSNKDKDFDYYHAKVDTSRNGENRDNNPAKPNLYFNDTKVCGGNNIYASKNIQFESITPVIQTLVFPGTNIISSLRTVSGTSIGSTSNSFVDQGYQDISIDGSTFFDNPRLVGSNINESNRLSTLPGNKSLNLKMNMITTDERLSPVIDLDRVSLILTENRINKPNIDYILDPSVNDLYNDPHAFQYVSKEIDLVSPATGLKIIVSAHINDLTDIRAFYSINSNGEKPVFVPFPGFNNLTSTGEIINPNNNDGSSDLKVQPSLNLSYNSEGSTFNQYEFTANKLPSFRDYRIKLVLTSSNQSFVPRLKNLKIIALA